MVFRSGRSIARLTQLNKQCVRKPTGSIKFERVPATYTALSILNSSLSRLQISPSTSFQARSYATKPAKPKAHQGTTAKARKPRAQASASKAAKPKAKTTTKKAAKPKKKAKAKPKAKKPARTKKALTPEETAKAKVNSLKKVALSPPAYRASSAWNIVLAETGKGQTRESLTSGSSGRTAAARYRSLSPEEREHYNHVANQTKEKAESEYRAWLKTHTPEQIRKANVARATLRRLKRTKQAKINTVYPALRDERLPKRASTSFNLFTHDRNASGDFAGLEIQERGRLVTKEWKALSPAERKVYEDRAQADRDRYAEEAKTVFGQDYKPTKKKATA